MTNAALAPRWFEPTAALPCPARHPQVIEQMLDDEVILTRPDTGAIARLNPTARALWRTCDPSRTTRDLVDLLVHAFDAEPAAAVDDVDQWLVCMASAGMLTVETTS